MFAVFTVLAQHDANKHDENVKVITVGPEGDFNVCTKCNDNTSSGC